jgi:DNA-binding XRE family transcriptional regulator
VTPRGKPDDTLSGAIIKLRQRVGSQVKLAKLVETSERTVKRWEGGVVPQKKFRPALIAQGVDARLFEDAAEREQMRKRLRFVESEVAKLNELLA